jgi:PEP-CTERM motif
VKKSWKSKLLAASLAVSALGVASPASALTFILNDVGGVTGTRAESGFRAAADFWSSIITNDVTITFNVGFADLGSDVLGSTGTNLALASVADVEAQIRALSSNTSVDQQVRSATGLPTLTNDALAVITPGYTDEANKFGIDTTKTVFDKDGSFNNSVIALSTANAKALGFMVDDSAGDADITFSSTFGFDFNPQDGISSGKYDFVAVAIHEFGHALGFISGADDYDFLGCPNGPACGAEATDPVNDTWWGYAADLFRYSAPDSLDWRPGVEAYFSIDQGASQFGVNSGFSTGPYSGDGSQASHWKANGTCSNFIGIMNPYVCNGRNGTVTSADIALFDAIGWNFNVDAGNANLAYSTLDIYAGGVPEPASWALMIAGFGLAGAAMRRRPSVKVAFSR